MMFKILQRVKPQHMGGLIVAWEALVECASAFGAVPRAAKQKKVTPFGDSVSRRWIQQGGAPTVISWFIIPLTIIDISTINHSYIGVVGAPN